MMMRSILGMQTLIGPKKFTLPSTATEAGLVQMRREKVFQYDVSKYPFGDAVSKILFSDFNNLHPREWPALDELHASGLGKEFIKDKSQNDLNYYQAEWNKRRSREECEGLYDEFDEIYDAFIKEVVGPALGGGIVLYQRAVTLRVYVPQEKPMGKLHNDCDYHHQPSELNYWLPLTTTYDTNSLWIESEPDKGDFHPIKASYGEYMRFYGNKCRHQTFANDTNSTRVSLDFRAVSQDSGGHDPSFRRGVRRGGKARYQKKFDVGGFYKMVKC
jgi:hypothetical protein